MYNVRIVVRRHHCAGHQLSQTLPITDTIQEDGDTLDRTVLCTGEFDGFIYIRRTCITLALKFLELDAGDVLKRLAECRAWGKEQIRSTSKVKEG